jgi:hypothetical protein
VTKQGRIHHEGTKKADDTKSTKKKAVIKDLSPQATLLPCLAPQASNLPCFLLRALREFFLLRAFVVNLACPSTNQKTIPTS